MKNFKRETDQLESTYAIESIERTVPEVEVKEQPNKQQANQLLWKQLIKPLSEWTKLPGVMLDVFHHGKEVVSWEYDNYLDEKFKVVDISSWSNKTIIKLQICN